jgi:hypothetical protein
MKKIIIAYHAYLFGNRYMEMINDQFRKINNSIWHEETQTFEKNVFSHCDKLYIGVVDSINKKPEYGIEFITNWFNNKSSKIITPQYEHKIEIVIYPDNKEEADTLKWIRDYAKNNPGDYILYFHMKGITKQNAATEDWRRYMEYFVIERWKDCIAKLDEGYDCCGVMWNSHTPIGEWPHFSGNFWWANTDYINTLNHEYLELPWRYYREFWIGSGPNVKVHEFHNSRMNDRYSLEAHKGHYDVEYPRNRYVS